MSCFTRHTAVIKLGDTEALQPEQTRPTLTADAHTQVKTLSRLLCLKWDWGSFEKWKDVDVEPDRLAWFLKTGSQWELRWKAQIRELILLLVMKRSEIQNFQKKKKIVDWKKQCDLVTCPSILSMRSLSLRTCNSNWACVHASTCWLNEFHVVHLDFMRWFCKHKWDLWLLWLHLTKDRVWK